MNRPAARSSNLHLRRPHPFGFAAHHLLLVDLLALESHPPGGVCELGVGALFWGGFLVLVLLNVLFVFLLHCLAKGHLGNMFIHYLFVFFSKLVKVPLWGGLWNNKVRM